MSIIDQIRESKTVEQITELLTKLHSPAYRFASSKTKNKAQRVAQQRIHSLHA